MAPFITTFPVEELTARIKLGPREKARKGFDGMLEKCEPLKMVQYECDVEGEKVICRPIERFFRRCRDTNKAFLVETTAWEKQRGSK